MLSYNTNSDLNVAPDSSSDERIGKLNLEFEFSFLYRFWARSFDRPVFQFSGVSFECNPSTFWGRRGQYMWEEPYTLRSTLEVLNPWPRRGQSEWVVMTEGTLGNSAALPECEIKIGLDPAAPGFSAVLEVRRGNPLSWCLANLHGILLSWTNGLQKLIREFGGSWGFCPRALALWSFPEKMLAIGAHVGLPQRRGLGMPLCLGTGTNETAWGSLWWVHVDHSSVDGFFSLLCRASLSHLRNVQILLSCS